ncbi:MAG: divalent metal cation transporter [Patescibacteria group bacterium]
MYDHRNISHKKIKVFSALGPGLVTGAADDDPSGIVTYTQAGAKYGLGFAWLSLYTWPMMLAIQEMCGRVGIVTGKGLIANIKEHYSKYTVYFVVGILLLANTINLGADIGAMASSLQLFVNAPLWLLSVIFFVLIVSLEIFLPYHKYAKVLKWLCLSLVAYFLTALIVQTNWGDVAIHTLVPKVSLNADFVFMLTAFVGTTISPYLFAWQVSQEVEEIKDKYLVGEKTTVSVSKIRAMRFDTLAGMFFSNLTALFIMITAAVVLNGNGITEISSAREASEALLPLVKNFPHAGQLASLLFAFGVIGTGLLAIPIFAAASSYAISEMLGWPEGLSKNFKEAKGFYGVIIIGTLVGMLLNFIGVNPIKALIYAAVLNGIIAVPMIFMIMRITNNKVIMGKYTSGFWSNLVGGVTFVVMLFAAVFTLTHLT